MIFIFGMHRHVVGTHHAWNGHIGGCHLCSLGSSFRSQRTASCSAASTNCALDNKTQTHGLFQESPIPVCMVHVCMDVYINIYIYICSITILCRYLYRLCKYMRAIFSSVVMSGSTLSFMRVSAKKHRVNTVSQTLHR